MKLSITTQLHPTYPLIFISIPQCTINHTIRIPTTTQIYHRITSTQICMSLHHLSFITSATKSNKTLKWAIWTMVIPAETVFLQIIILILIQMCQNLLTLNAIPFTPQLTQLTQFLPFFHPTFRSAPKSTLHPLVPFKIPTRARLIDYKRASKSRLMMRIS